MEYGTLKFQRYLRKCQTKPEMNSSYSGKSRFYSGTTAIAEKWNYALGSVPNTARKSGDL